MTGAFSMSRGCSRRWDIRGEYTRPAARILMHFCVPANLAQGAAFRTIKGVNPKLKVGTTYRVSYCQPATDSQADKKAAARGCVGQRVVPATGDDRYVPRGVRGGNPLEKVGVKAGDMELVKAPLDFFGMNYYQRTIIVAAQPNKNRLGVDLTDSGGTDGPKTDIGWEIWPDGFYELLLRISREYKSMPMEITGTRHHT
jgi:beta-glucosidase